MGRRLAIPTYLGIPWWCVFVACILEEAVRGAARAESLQIISVITLWGYVQAIWLKRAMPGSRALYWYFSADALALLGSLSDHFHFQNWIGIVIGVSTAAVGIAAIFVFRAEFERNFNQDASPWLSIRLGAVMTFFFSVMYFQYYFQQLYREQQAALVSAATPPGDS
jgi:hypothetical protein